MDHNPEKGFIKGIFKEQFLPERIALPPPKEPSKATDHLKWTKYLSDEIRTAITTDFEDTFAKPIIKAIESQITVPPPKCFCKEGKYPELLDRMNTSVLIRWRLDEDRKTILSNYAHILQITSFAITKSVDLDRLISWPRVRNMYSKEPPNPEIPDPTLFEFLVCDDAKLKGF